MTRRKLLHNGAAAAMAGMLWQRGLAGAAAGPIKVGMIGTAHSHAAGKWEAIRKMPEVFEVVGVVEADEQRRKSAQGRREYADVKWMSEQELLDTRGLEAVLVETAVREQGPTGLRVAKAGLHLHLEKPGSARASEFIDLVGQMQRSGKVLQLGYMFRGNAAFEVCFKAVREGWLGEVFEVSGVIGKVVGKKEREETAEFAGGMMFELGCHLIDAVVAVLGKPQAVHAHLRRTRPDQDSLADNTMALLEYPKAIASVRCAALDVEGSARRQFVVCGDKGTATILPLEPPRMTLTLTEDRGEYKRGTQPVKLREMAGRYGDQLKDFAKIVRGEKKSEFGYGHELAVHETVLRASHSG